jgi:23S rRNA pseudouridine2605 synthase
MTKAPENNGRRPRKPAHKHSAGGRTPAREGKRPRHGADAQSSFKPRGAQSASRSGDKSPSRFRDKREGGDGARPQRRDRYEPRSTVGESKGARFKSPRNTSFSGEVADHTPWRSDQRAERKDQSNRNNTRPSYRGKSKDGARSPRGSDYRQERKNTPRSAPQPSAVEGERIAKVMARAGLCSRRDAELWIAEGRVEVNGEILSSPARNVVTADRIKVDGKALAQRERTRLFLFNKPRGLVTTDHDPEGRPTVFSALPAWMPRVMTIGRLDINTEGLLLLTNDGGLARVLELPATGWLRRYRVRANGSINQAVLDELRQGISIDGVDYAGIEAKLDRVQGANVWLTMGLREGKNREIKRVLEHLGLAVNRLIRLSFGPFQLAELGEGDVEEIKTRILRDQLGEALTTQAGCDFDGPILTSPEMPDFEIPRMRAQPTSRQPMSRQSVSRYSHRDRGREREQEEEQAPRKDRPPPRTRKHISTLRAQKDKTPHMRRAVERTQTEDRKGRSVAVERVNSKRSPSAQSKNRNEKRFAQERSAQHKPQGGKTDYQRRPKPAGGGRKRPRD